MTNRKRNYAIIGLIVALLVGAGALISSKPTRLGLDLKGGVELIYEARPTPKVPEVTPQAVDDAIETIRQRTDALGVSEPEIQRAGANQISIGLPAVDNAERAERQVGTTAQLQFYDWEPNLIGEDGKPAPEGTGVDDAPVPSLQAAVERAGKAKPEAEPEDVPPGGPEAEVRDRLGGDEARIGEFYDRQNDSAGGDRFYLFGPDRKPLGGPEASCKDLLGDFAKDAPAGSAASAREVPKGSECSVELRALGSAGPPDKSRVLKVPRGIVVVKAERPPNLPVDAPFERYHVLEDDSELSGNEIKDPKQEFDQQGGNEPIVTFSFTDRGQKAFAEVTRRIAQRGAQVILPPGTPPDAANQRFSITLDNEIVSLATIDFQEYPEGIDGRTGTQINGIGNIDETQDLAESLRIGALPIELKLISKTQVSATLGQAALDQGLLAAGVGLLLTLTFLIVFYRVLGVVAATALVVYAVFLFAIVKLIPITLTLPGIAGLILTLGVAADANIVIFERIKEEARAGRSIPAAISGGYAKALRTIIDANVVTVGVAFILFMLATAGVKGFAFTLGVGTLVSLLTAVLATSAILGSLSRTRLLRSRHALGAGGEGRPWTFDFMGASKWFFSASGLILAIGAIAIAGLGINFGIDFDSGTRIRAALEQPTDVEGLRDALPGELQDAEIQKVTDEDLGDNAFQISTETLAPDRVASVENTLDESFGVAEIQANSIGPTFGAQIARTALIAIIASLFLISLYIGLRFSFKYAVPVLIALAHDLLITAGVYAIFGQEVSTATVAALLTILGYSLYDTIIVFDRIRENVPRMPRATFSQIVNRSMSEVLTRSLVTSFSTLLPVAALMLFGGETLRAFGFALLVGVASGTYSSIFIAAPVLTAWKEREPRYRRMRQIVSEDHGGEVPAYSKAALGSGDGDGAGPGGAPGRRKLGAPVQAPSAAPGILPAGPDGPGPPAEPGEPAAAGPRGRRRRATSTRLRRAGATPGSREAGQPNGDASPGEASGDASPEAVNGGASPDKAIGGASPGDVNGGAAPDEAIGNTSPGDVNGGAAPEETNGGASPDGGSGGPVVDRDGDDSPTARDGGNGAGSATGPTGGAAGGASSRARRAARRKKHGRPR